MLKKLTIEMMRALAEERGGARRLVSAESLALRYLSAGFVPDRFFKDAFAEMKALSSKPIKNLDDVAYLINAELIPFYNKTIKKLVELAPSAKQTLEDRSMLRKEVLLRISDNYKNLERAIGAPYPAKTAEDQIRLHVEVEVSGIVVKRIPTLDKALSSQWLVEPSKIDALVRRALKQATPEELAAVEDAENWNSKVMNLRFGFFQRAVDKSIPRLVKREKVDVKPFKQWLEFIRGVLVSNYSEPVYSQFDIHGMKVVINDATITAKQQQEYVKYLDAAYQRMKAKGVARAWYGTVYVECKECGGVNSNDPSLGVGGHFNIQKDHVKIFSRPSSYIVELMAHELGHRYWFKSMSQSQRMKFESLVKVKPKEVYVPSKVDSKDIAAAKDRVISAQGALTKELVDFNKSRLKWYLKVLDKFAHPVGQAGYTFSDDLISATQIPGAYEDSPQVVALRDRLLKETTEVSQFLSRLYDEIQKRVNRYPDGTDWSVAWKEVKAQWLNESYALIDAAVKTADDLINARVKAQNDKVDAKLKENSDAYSKDTRQVAPVSDYGKSNIDEAFAEVFAHYVVGKDMNRDQLESFKEVLLSKDKRAASQGPRPTKVEDEVYMPLSEDRFVHFTTRERADKILADGKLRMRPPYAKFGTDTVDAVSTVWGAFVPGVQTRHLQKYADAEGGLVAILFMTSTMPHVGFIEEVKWHQDVTLKRAVVISADKAKSMLARTPHQLQDDMTTVIYQQSKLARAIRLDKHSIGEMAKLLEQALGQRIRGKKGPLGENIIVKGHPYPIRAVDGTTLTTYLRLQSIPTKDFKYIPSGGLGFSQGKPVVVVHVNGSIDAEQLYKGTTSHLVQRQLYPVLLHELTHAADKFSRGVGESMSQEEALNNEAYYNHPTEVRAYLQEVVDETSEFFKHYEQLQRHFGNRAVEILMQRSSTWEEVSPYWTEQNKRKVIKAVVQALSDWQSREKIATRYLQAGSMAFDLKAIDKLRKDFLILVKNVPKVVSQMKDSYDWTLLEEFRQVVRRYRVAFHQLVFEELPKAVKNDPNVRSDEEQQSILRSMRDSGWAFYGALEWPARMDSHNAVTAWDKKVRRKAQEFWKDAKRTLDWYQRLRNSQGVPMSTPDRLVIEGFQAEIIDYDESDDYHRQGLERLKAGLSTYRQRARKTVPWLIQHQLPLEVTFDISLTKGGSYHGKYILLYALSGDMKDPARVTHIMAHEMGHHLFKHLSSGSVDYWNTAIKQDYGPLDIRDVLAKWPGNVTSSGFAESIAQSDPVLSLQLDGLSQGHGDKQYWRKEDFQEALDGGLTTLSVPKTPITGYAGKNPEEAFCEALGLLVAYGPRAVHEKIRHYLEIVIPGKIKLARIEDRIVDRYLALAV